jgi:arylsulfatase A-like enzyme
MSLRRLLLACTVAFLVLTSHATAQTRPNVLFIAIDDLNDWVGFLQGHPQTRTPNMDRLARRGVVFTNAHCAAPLCCPSRSAVFSGVQPFRSGVYGNNDDLRAIRPDLVLLPTHFKAAGYQTLGTGKLLHQKRPDLFDESSAQEQRWSPFKPGDVNYTAEELPSKSSKPRHVTSLVAGGKPVILPRNGMPSDRAPQSPQGESFDWGPLDVPDDSMGDVLVADWAAQRLQQAQAPFFLGVGFYRPHIPLFAPRKYFEAFPPGSISLPAAPADDLDDLSAIARRIAIEADTAGRHDTVMQHGQWEEAVAAYLACVHFVDAQIGKLLDALDRGPHAANTVIVLWGDHGWHLGEKQHWGKSTGWERATRVPLLIAPAKQSAGEFAVGGSCAGAVSLIDLYPTLIELCGLPARPGLDGTSLVTQLRNPQTPSARAVVTTFYAEHFSVRDSRWRYIRYNDGSEELYDHQTDEAERKNLAADRQHAATKQRLAQSLPANPVKPAPASRLKEQ